MAGRRCRVDDHPERERIREDLVTQQLSLSAIAGYSGIPTSTLSQYRRDKLFKDVAKYSKVQEEQGIRQSQSIRERIENILNDLYELLRAAKEDEKSGGWGALGCYREIRGYIEMLYKIEREGDERPENLYTSEEIAIMLHELIRKHRAIGDDVRKMFGLGERKAKKDSG